MIERTTYAIECTQTYTPEFQISLLYAKFFHTFTTILNLLVNAAPVK